MKTDKHRWSGLVGLILVTGCWMLLIASPVYGASRRWIPKIAATVDIGVPPTNMFVRAVGNPMSSGGLGGATAFMVENFIYDTNSTTYWGVAYQQNVPQGVALLTCAGASDPKVPSNWSYVSNIVAQASDVAPCLYPWTNGYFYIFYSTSDSGPIVVISNTTPYGTFSAARTMLSAGSGWESSRAKEPYVFSRAHAGDLAMLYMGDNGTSEKTGLATASDPSGPWTKYAGNPLVNTNALAGAGGLWNSVAGDPFAYKWQNTYYIICGSQFGPMATVALGNQEGITTTTDFITVTPSAGTVWATTNYTLYAWESNQIFRGAIMGGPSMPWPFLTNEYMAWFVGGPSTAFKSGIMTCPTHTLAPSATGAAWVQTGSAAGTVTWTSDINTYGYVQWGTSSGVYGSSANESATGISNFTHTATLSGLSASTTYFEKATSTNILSAATGTPGETSFTTYAGWPTFVQANSTNNGGAGTKLVCQLLSAPVANNVAIVSTFRNSGSATEALTDTQGMTWTLLTNVTYNAGGQQIAVYWGKILSTATLRVTNTTSASLSFNGLQVLEYSGVNNTAPLDVAMTQTGTTSSSVALSVGPMTTTANGDLMILIIGAPSTTWASSGVFTLREPSGTHTGGTELDSNQSAAGAVSGTATTGNGGNAYGALFVTLKHL